MTAITALAHLQACGKRKAGKSPPDEELRLFIGDTSSSLPLHQAVVPEPAFVDHLEQDRLEKDGGAQCDLSEEEKSLLQSMKADGDEKVDFFQTSCATKVGVDAARSRACDLLLDRRVEQKVKQGKNDSLRSRLYVTQAAARSDRPPCIPQSVLSSDAHLAP
eukprot:5904898-Amphidinium_carterae.1